LADKGLEPFQKGKAGMLDSILCEKACWVLFFSCACY